MGAIRRTILSLLARRCQAATVNWSAPKSGVQISIGKYLRCFTMPRRRHALARTRGLQFANLTERKTGELNLRTPINHLSGRDLYRLSPRRQTALFMSRIHSPGCDDTSSMSPSLYAPLWYALCAPAWHPYRFWPTTHPVCRITQKRAFYRAPASAHTL